MRGKYSDKDRNNCSSLKDFFPALFLLLFSSMYFVYLFFRPPEMTKQIAVLFPPNITFQQIHSYLAEIDARIVRVGLWDNLVVIDLGAKLDTSMIQIPGALLLLDAVTTGGCFFY
ncbi:hypothetical protein [Kiloniella antarctica]|uniref:Uncharacterized protein n=1 Tax=Kiloniella antarctica TaxID=1550907 RepID=A0ABW5BJ49_9PROT